MFINGGLFGGAVRRLKWDIHHPRRVRPPGTPPPDCTCYQWRGEEIPQKNSRISNCKVEYFPRQITTLVVHSYTRSEATQNATSMATDTIPLRHLIKVLT